MEWLVAVVALVLAVPVVMYVGQDRLLFHPVELAGAGHNSTDDVPAFWQAIREFLVQPH
jgi:hypothetical protein